MAGQFLSKLKIFNRDRRGRPRATPDDLSELFRFKYDCFKELLASNSENLNIIADMEEKLQGHQVFGMAYVRSQSARSVFYTLRMVKGLDGLSGHRYPTLFQVLEEINAGIKGELEARREIPVAELVLPYSQIDKTMADWVGGKSANLGEVLNRAGLPIPEGFAITTRAFQLFLERNDLVDEINKHKMDLDPKDPGTMARVSEEIQRSIISAELPGELEEAIRSAYGKLGARVAGSEPRDGGLRVSMRSSAIGEDSEVSYAGQYLSSLNVPEDRLIQTYKFIVASLYTPRAISYRLNKGLRDEDIAMSVACLRMLDSVASGVMYSRHPFDALEDHVIITAVWGLGPYAVGGVITPDLYVVAKGEANPVLHTRVSHKPVQLVSEQNGGLTEIPVPEAQQDQPCLSPEQIRTLAGYALRLEAHFGCPQDMEWALDVDENLYVLQARPLQCRATDGDRLVCPRIPKAREYPVLIETGQVAHPGVGFGPAFHVRTEEDLASFPDGAVLVARHSSPKFVVVMPRAQAIVTDAGSVTGHMASLAREFAVPSILDTKLATSRIPSGTLVTVDAYSGKVYEGQVPELLALQVPRQPHMRDTPVYETLKRVTRWIIPLNLVDPKASSFSPQGCRTLHDIMRFVHEVSYTEMFHISDRVSQETGTGLKLEAPIPLDLRILDLGEGLVNVQEGSRKVAVEQVASIPFRALLRGMMHEGLRHREPRPVELRGFLSVMSEQMFTNPHASERFGERSYAILSDKYVNFSSRVGYHYGVLDSYCGNTVSKNYVTFSFQGGAADDVRRNRRARAIAAILDHLGFSVEVKGDRVTARLQKVDRGTLEEKLDRVGRLLIFTRQMDMLMADEASVGSVIKDFLEGNYRWEASHSPTTNGA